jgi:hypothetical protein
MFGGRSSEVAALGKVVAEQAAEVVVGTALPEAALRAERSLNPGPDRQANEI